MAPVRAVNGVSFSARREFIARWPPMAPANPLCSSCLSGLVRPDIRDRIEVMARHDAESGSGAGRLGIVYQQRPRLELSVTAICCSMPPHGIPRSVAKPRIEIRAGAPRPRRSAHDKASQLTAGIRRRVELRVPLLHEASAVDG